MQEWLLFLGAGASVASPTRLPLFLPLAEGVLRGMGWTPAQIDGRGAWIHPRYPAFDDPDLSAEVLFGALQRFGVGFTDELADVFADRPPNAVHEVAAAVLKAGGCVWTTNMDEAVEAACRRDGWAPRLAGRASDRAGGLLTPLHEANNGTLVKLHGTASTPHTMAFADRDLMSPLPSADADHLAGLADGRTVILYGYAGADADLADLLDDVFRRAHEVVWFEPFARPRQDILRAFRNADQIIFEPALSNDHRRDLPANSRAFLALAASAGANVNEVSAAALHAFERPPGPPQLRFERPPGIAQARLVERFGHPDSHDDALWAARFDDLQHRQWGTVKGHLRWAVTQSLYGAGIAATSIRWLIAHRRLMARLPPRALRDYAITRACALLLLDSDWRKLGAFAEWATRTRRTEDGRPYPSDLYYRAQARRYELRPQQARADADQAATGLASTATADPERLAGALLESGIAALYQGRFEDAQARAFDLRYRRGRYAIARWRGWGAWLSAVALCHLGRPGDAREALEEADQRFAADGRDGPQRDVQTARLLAMRVGLALDEPVDTKTLHNARRLPAEGRYRDDLDLVVADLLIATGEPADAEHRLRRVRVAASSPIAAAMADLGLAELTRLAGDRHAAAEAFSALAERAETQGATWLQAQAVLGLDACGDERAQLAWPRLRSAMPDGASHDEPATLALGEPRVLWLLTL